MLIYDNWCKYDKIMCLLIKVLASLTSESRIFFFTFPKNWVGRAMRNEALNWDGLTFIRTTHIIYHKILVCEVIRHFRSFPR